MAAATERTVITENLPPGYTTGPAGVEYIDPLVHRNVNLGTRDEFLMDHDHRRRLSKKEFKRIYGRKPSKHEREVWNATHIVEYPGMMSGAYGMGMGPSMMGPGSAYGIPGMGVSIPMGHGGHLVEPMGHIRDRDLERGIAPATTGYGLGYGGLGGMGMGSGLYGGMGSGLYGGMGSGLYGGMGGMGGMAPGMGMGSGLYGGMGQGMMGQGLGMGRGMGGFGGMGQGMMGQGMMGQGMMGQGMMGQGLGMMNRPIDDARFLKLPHWERINDNPNIDNTTLWRPRADIFDIDQEHLKVEFELPGVPREDISLTIQDNVLTLAALKPQTRKEEVGFHYQHERHFGKFYRRIALPFNVDTNKVKAHMDNGVLKVHLVRMGGVAGRIPIAEGMVTQQTTTTGTMGSSTSGTSAVATTRL